MPSVRMRLEQFHLYCQVQKIGYNFIYNLKYLYFASALDNYLEQIFFKIDNCNVKCFYER